ARPLDQLTAGQLRTWLQVRRDRWPATANPHLLINQSTAGGTRPVTRSYVQASLRRAASPPRTCAPTGSWTRHAAAAVTRSSSRTCSGSATPPPSATAPRPACPGQDRDNEMARQTLGR